ncbi:RsmB/NOP family class I SAM-dependent RNA methyltransferase [Pseudohalocynthiibacter aestuariivivens]|nr:RsmB/NOP family class I SAM-dependent RNA methyltransferase [Pseudohalocynthiibacter aestuariivivens]QIE44349.1 RsmB/NOP family class I SAM-dependent RNA methyltransferase [Pseudohalocynthiibacter aestuariivivens]
MTPGARIQAAIEILDAITDETAAERALTGWARRSRFAGSKDRAAVRDHVFQALRCWRSYACLGGADTGRGRMIGALRADDTDPALLFTGVGHAPAPLSAVELTSGTPAVTDADRLDLQPWLVERFQGSLGDDAERAAMALRARAPVMLRVNLRKGSVDQAMQSLAADEIATAPIDGINTALQVIDNHRKVLSSATFQNGLVEFQDSSSQKAMQTIVLPAGARILDYCAGGGGKALALAARLDATIYAHDADPSRMKDLPARASRAGAQIRILDEDAVARAAPYDMVLCDVPCSGSGTWRRAPDAKWRLSEASLGALVDVQSVILDTARSLIAPGGTLVYATCSVLREENEQQIEEFVRRHSGWSVVSVARLPISAVGDGFFVAHLLRE